MTAVAETTRNAGSARTALYRMYDAAGDLLYVGMSRNLPSRITMHVTEKSWWETVARIEVQHFESREKARQEEKRAIAEDAPLWNVLDRAATAPARSTEIAAERIFPELDRLTEIRKAGAEASRKARPLVEAALIAGVASIDLVGRPFSRPEIQNIKKALRESGQIPAA